MYGDYVENVAGIHLCCEYVAIWSLISWAGGAKIVRWELGCNTRQDLRIMCQIATRPCNRIARSSATEMPL